MTTLPPPALPTVLVVDDDRDIRRAAELVLTDAGYTVAGLDQVTPEHVIAAVDRVAPACVLLDGSAPGSYGASWELAQQLRMRMPPVPVVMFTAHRTDLEEAHAGTSARSPAARFAAVVSKPFDLDALLTAVRQAVGGPVE
jgi:twitching motility two-component system response regulator PilG